MAPNRLFWKQADTRLLQAKPCMGGPSVAYCERAPAFPHCWSLLFHKSSRWPINSLSLYCYKVSGPFTNIKADTILSLVTDGKFEQWFHKSLLSSPLSLRDWWWAWPTADAELTFRWIQPTVMANHCGCRETVSESTQGRSGKGHWSRVCELCFVFNWKIITLQYCVGFCHTTWICHKYAYIPSILNFPPTPQPTPPYPSRLWQSSGLSFPCYTPNAHQLSILHIVMYMPQCHPLHLSHPLFPPCVQKSVVPCLCPHSYPANIVNGTIFRDSIYVC